ncbi:LysM peptidoglycan-binding domain-containing protein [Brevibacillus sp. 7WMA2]|uniref:cell division suppressor protein YneA n=1 Tax=Brevibacillus TaxID=55080 RepID=UPI000C772DAC|nr:MULTISPECIES: LysM peptidoglycan-binding domain-containing protein [Brevibacillus]AUM65646.1 peptidoglycan-binding protein LysM [Brevibacillus laterosporus]AYK08652.1 LysM peptidoglycan-binding domain-containing protein [Brevibacillus laterosporus]MBA4535371.1 LysM peptidoglycan-binding domain-containing protein [Brevibacillus halotolerans]QIC05401.1 LysM peptidoglycan-binding domain-containing protein [Brevibacillus sp. 7WMA2]WPS86233.1 LysM peptidoglycan-binding domain-containing protein 
MMVQSSNCQNLYKDKTKTMTSKNTLVHHRKGITRGQAIVTLLLIIVSFAAGSMIFGKEKVAIAAPHTQQAAIVITIQPGDTLWSIAQAYQQESGLSARELMDEIMKQNQLDSPMIYAGNNLAIPVYR